MNSNHSTATTTTTNPREEEFGYFCLRDKTEQK
jgi:hypothetical protein